MCSAKQAHSGRCICLGKHSFVLIIDDNTKHILVNHMAMSCQHSYSCALVKSLSTTGLLVLHWEGEKNGGGDLG